jgi:predicted deacylase
MAVSEYFANSYSEARTKFLAAAHAAGSHLDHYTLSDFRGPDDEDLTIDVALLGAQNPENLLVLISGTHGVEGFCGSGCQIGYLADQLYEALSSTTALLVIHALNPFVFAWLRRVNEDNVDLNRNFHDFSKPLPASENYEALHDLLIPEQWEGGQRDKADAALQQYIAKKGFRTFQAGVAEGQYTRPRGLFYGGNKPTWSNKILKQILADRVTSTIKKLAVIDFHTGLGKTGFGEPIYVSSTDDSFDLAKAWYGEEIKNLSQGTAVATALTGSIADGLPRPTSNLQVIYLALEFGTIPALEVLNALRADHWLHAVPDRVTHLRDGIKRQIRDAFYFDAAWWKAAVYARAVDFAMRATRALHN